MNVLITGGSGFFGSAIVKAFLDRGDHLTVISRSKPHLRSHPNLLYKSGDITYPKSLNKVDGSAYDLLIHSAAHMPKSPTADKPAVLLQTNVIGTLHVMEKLAPYAKKIIYISSIDVFGGTESKNKSIDERSETKPRSYYGLTKLSGEKISEIYCHNRKLPLTILRFTVLYGPGDVIDRAIPNFIKNSLANVPLVVPKERILRDYLSTAEAARAVCLAASSAKTGTYVIGSGKSHDVKKVAGIIRSHLRSKSQIITKSSGSVQFQVLLNCQKAQGDFHFTAKSFPFNLEETTSWYKARVRR